MSESIKYVVGARLPVTSAVAVNRGSVWIQGAVTRARVAVAIHNGFSVFLMNVLTEYQSEKNTVRPTPEDPDHSLRFNAIAKLGPRAFSAGKEPGVQ